MTNLENEQHESEFEDGDHDQFDLGMSFDDLESGYFENQTHLPADIHEKIENEYREEYEEVYGSDEDWHGDSEDSLELDSNSEWTDALENLKSCKEKLDRITKERKTAYNEFNEAKSQLFQLLDSNNTDAYTTDDYIVRRIPRKGRVSYRNAMVDICSGETDLFTYYSDKHRGEPYYTLRIRKVQ